MILEFALQSGYTAFSGFLLRNEGLSKAGNYSQRGHNSLPSLPIVSNFSSLELYDKLIIILIIYKKIKNIWIPEAKTRSFMSKIIFAKPLKKEMFT